MRLLFYRELGALLRLQAPNSKGLSPHPFADRYGTSKRSRRSLGRLKEFAYFILPSTVQKPCHGHPGAALKRCARNMVLLKHPYIDGYKPLTICSRG